LRKLLSQLATIQSGIYAKPEPGGEVYYIQARHFNHKHQFNNHVIPDLKADGKINKHFLRPGNLLVAAKGKEHYAVEYDGTIKPAVASSIFIVIRLKQSEVVPSFLAWYINLASTQKFLSDSAKGTSLPVINKGDLEKLEIPVPSIEKQQLILKINDLHQQEISLKEKIDSLKNKLIQHEIINALSN
jgi:restriction endonuclease S subunit